MFFFCCFPSIFKNLRPVIIIQELKSKVVNTDFFILRTNLFIDIAIIFRGNLLPDHLSKREINCMVGLS